MTRWLILSLALTVGVLVASLYVYASRAELLPAEVPTHWGISGEPDIWTPRDAMLPQLLLMPALMLLMTAMTLVLPWISPKQFGVEEFRGTWDYLMALVVGLFAYLSCVVLVGYVWPGIDVARTIVAGIFPFFAVLGNSLGKVRRNFWMGVRTPWTLASEIVWTQTHRVAAWLFVAAGAIGFVATVAQAPLWVGFPLIIVAGLVPVLYSLVLYKRLERQGRL